MAKPSSTKQSNKQKVDNPEAHEQARTAPEYAEEMRLKRRDRKASVATEGGLGGGAHGIMNTDEKIEGEPEVDE